MSVFNKPWPVKPKIITKHPWEHRIKSEYSNIYKNGHNSVNNPPFISVEEQMKRKKSKIEEENRFKFIVIGNRVTKEFIYCLHVVTALHTYRKKLFHPPTIRGVTSVEWPKVLNDLKIQFGELAFCLKSQVVVLLDGKILGGEKELRDYLEARYDYRSPLYLDYFQEGIKQFANFIHSYGRPCVFMHISINNVPIGPLIFMLYADIVPLTCQNFIRMCSTKRGGYAGTPIHRIVKDSWIQCGGYFLKSRTKLNCENFIVPHDRRGVLCMANDGRHIDCSTQFFVILQPSMWMAHKYVAFGQLIEGEETLQKIESVPTWYESPTSEIIIFKTGVFNMDCQWVSINKSINQFYDLHMDDRNVIREMYYEALLAKVFKKVDLRAFVRETFVKPTIEAFIETIPEPVDPKSKKPQHKEVKETPSPISTPNQEFDVDVYEYYEGGGEEFDIQEEVRESPSVHRERSIFFYPLSDVPYPGEVQSAFDLKRLLKGDYCLETDLEEKRPKKQIQDTPKKIEIPDDIYEALFSVYAELDSVLSLDSEENLEMKEYLKEYADSASFSGPVIEKIANLKNKFDHLTEEKRISIYSDEEMRIIRTAAKAPQKHGHKRVVVSSSTKISNKIVRRPTGFVRPEDLARIEAFEKYNDEEDDDEDVEKERIAILNAAYDERESRRLSHDDQQHRKTSTLYRLFEDVIDSDEDIPTLKNYKPLSQVREEKNYTYLTNSPLAFHNDSPNKLFFRPFLKDQHDLKDTLTIQHGKKVSRKISSDYANTISHFERVAEKSIRSIEYAKHRPALTVMEYKLKNQKYEEKMKESKTNISKF